MRERVFANGRLKLLSLVLAIAFLIFVRGERAREEIVNLQVSVRIKNIPDDRILVTPVSDKITLVVAGPRSRVRDATERRLAALDIDASRLSSGPYRFSPDQFEIPKGTKIVSIAPPEIVLEFEDRLERRVPVRVVHRALPPPGFRLESIVANPPDVLASGPRGRVDRVSSISTEEISLHATTQSFTRDALLIVNGLGVRVAPTRVQIKTIVSPIIERRRLSALPVRLLTEVDRKLLVSIEPTTLDIDVEGPVSQLTALRETDIVAVIDLRRRAFTTPTTFESAARIDNLPIDVRPVGFNPKKFRVIVSRRR